MSKIEELQSKCRSMEDILTRVDQFVDEINWAKDIAQEKAALQRDLMKKQVLKDLDELYSYIKSKTIFRPGMFNDIKIDLGKKLLKCSVHFDCTEYAGSGPIARIFEKAGLSISYDEQAGYNVTHPHIVIYLSHTPESNVCYVDGYWNADNSDKVESIDEMLVHWTEILEQMYENIIQEYEAYMKRTMMKATQEYSDAICKCNKLAAVNNAMQNMNT